MAATATLACAADAIAQQWPQARPIKVIVPFPPGGVTDSVARITADWLSKRLGQAVVAENKPGASGAIAADYVARSDPDGYTLFTASAAQLAILPHVQKISYDSLKDFALISIIGTNNLLLGVSSSIAVKSLKDFVDYAKARPGQLNFASSGYGGTAHLTMAMFMARAGVKLEPILYKGGGPATAALLAGEVQAFYGNMSELMPHAGSGKIDILAMTGEQRSPQLADVPTVAEQGYPGFRALNWNSYVAPARMPREMVDRIAREIVAACRDATFVDRLNRIGVDPVCNTPSEFSQVLRDDFALWRSAVQAAGIKPQ